MEFNPIYSLILFIPLELPLKLLFIRFDLTILIRLLL